MNTSARRIPSARSADLQSAVSPICNRQVYLLSTSQGISARPQNPILRYSRLQICATKTFVMRRMKAKQILANLICVAVLLSATASRAATFTAQATGNWNGNAVAIWGATATSRAGTITATTSSSTVTGSGTSFNTVLSVGDSVYNSGSTYLGAVGSIATATSLTLLANSAAVATASAWSSARPPTSSDDAIIPSGRTITIQNT